LIDENSLITIKENIKLAPIHMPHMVKGIEILKRLLPDIPMVAVMDTSFHQTMPEKAYIYSIPYEYYQRHGIRRYGFHGTSHSYVSQKAAQILNKPYNKLKIVSCHLGSGSSITAICDGISVDTSMGFTPISGISMGTRSGDIDPCIIGYIMEKEKSTYNEVEAILNQKSGLLGVSGISSDFREVELHAKGGNKRAELAIEIFCYNAKKYIGAYAAAMEGLDCIIFTGGIGENSAAVRRKICNGLAFLGVMLDPVKNEQEKNQPNSDRIISKDDSEADICLVHTNEEYMIAIETMDVIKRLKVLSTMEN
ncbi:MAG: acetate/propionate family kinase, partial [Eubacteriales bacterium]|nr:acetate/propionate family kinase [Eubacteriales bacterium]